MRATVRSWCSCTSVATGLGLFALLGGFCPALAAIPFTVTPVSSAADARGGITIQTSAASAGGSVTVRMFHDFNQDGAVNGTEWPLITAVLQDNGPSSDSESIAADSNPAAAAITAVLQPPTAYMPTGKFILVASNETGETAQATVTITPVTAPLQISGRILLQNTTTPVADAVIFCDDDTGNTMSVAYSDQTGMFTLPLAAAGTYSLGSMRPGLIGGMVQNLQVASSLSNYTLTMTVADATVTGILREFGTNAPLAGFPVFAESLTGTETAGFTQADGSFTLPVLTGMDWSIGFDALPGYFGILSPDYNYRTNPVISPAASPAANVANFTAHRETAWIEGTVYDERNAKLVEGALLFANRINTQIPALQALSNGHYTGADGTVSVGLEPGDWNVGLCMNCHEHPTLVEGVARELVPGPQVTVHNLTLNEHRQLSMQVYYADGAIEGIVYRQDCQTPAPAGVRVSAWSANPLNGTGQQPVGQPINTDAETGADGRFRIPVLGGSWTIRANMYEWGLQSADEIRQLNTNGDEIVAGGEVAGGLSLCLNLPIDNGDPGGNPDQVRGTVRSALLGGSQPVIGATVELLAAGQTLQTTATDGNGTFQFGGVQGGDYTLRVTLPGLTPLVQSITKTDGQALFLDSLPEMTVAATGGPPSCDATGNGQLDLGDVIYWLRTLGVN